MARTKQISLSVPKDQLAALAHFDAHISSLGVTRSEMLMKMINQYLDENGRPKHEALKPRAELPDFLT